MGKLRHSLATTPQLDSEGLTLCLGAPHWTIPTASSSLHHRLQGPWAGGSILPPHVPCLHLHCLLHPSHPLSLSPCPAPRASSHPGCPCLPEPSQPPPLLQQLVTVVLTHLAPWPRWARAGQKTGLFDKNQEIRPLGLGAPELPLVLHPPGGYSPEKARRSGSSTWTRAWGPATTGPCLTRPDLRCGPRARVRSPTAGYGPGAHPMRWHLRVPLGVRSGSQRSPRELAP